MVASTTHLLAAMAVAAMMTGAASNQPAPACRDKCGDITVPYPFGIDAGCYRDDGVQGFRLECDETRSPPHLTISASSRQSEGQIRLSGLGLDAGEAGAYMDATRSCYNSTGGLINSTGGNYMSLIGSHYLFSNAKKSLVSLGCPNLGYFVDGDGYYVSGCMSVCRPSQNAIPGICTGVGCCESSIPPDMDFFEPDMLDFPQGQGDGIFGVNITACRYVFLVETLWWLMTSYSDAYRDRSDDLVVPIVLDWAIRNVGNCTAGRRNATDYACRSALSKCVDSTNGPGYRCSCFSGYQGNPYLDGGCKDIDECQHRDQFPCHGVCTNTPGSYTCQCPPGTSGDASRLNGCRPKDKFTFALRVVTGVSAGVFLLGFMCFWLYLGFHKRKLIRAKQKFFEQNGGVLLQQQMRSYDRAGAAGFKIFSTEELEKATNGFAADRVLGRGGHGIVYRGVLDDKRVVAIKKSKMMEEAETREFAREMFILSQINHRNVVKLLGCCLEVEVPMLVYEFVSHGTLYHYIHGNGKDANADDIALDTRLRIAAESAEALAYMHSSASPPILHGDVKTANILLDDKLTAKVSDFGTSKLAPDDEAEIATLVQGTWGYLDPEYLMTCHLTDKSDVYSFGVVLLELLTRKKALYFEGPEEDRSLVSCFITAVRAGRIEELLDSQARNEISACEILQEIVDLAMQCVSISGEERPPMKEVAERLVRLRRYQHHPWTEADGNPETQGLLLVSDQRSGHLQFQQQNHALNIEDGTTYFTL